MDNLLPCPFCGGDAEVQLIGGACHPGCTSCFLMMMGHDSEEDAITAWNTRHTPEGWKLVPVEADLDMRKAARPYPQAGLGLWHAMLAAAPKWGGE